MKEARCFRRILPMQVKFMNGKRAYTYALLDSGPNRTVMTKAFVKRMGALMREEVISLQGLGVVRMGA